MQPLPRTLLLTLRARAQEHRRPDRLFADPTAADWSARLPWPAEYERFLTPGYQTVFAVRTRLFDDAARRFLAEHPDALIVELGAGLSTRRQRIGAGRWLLLDLPEALDLRRELTGPGEDLLAGDLLGTAWMEAITYEPVLFIAEGVLLFLPGEAVARMLSGMRTHFPGAHILLDASGHTLKKRQSERFLAIDAPLGWTVTSEADVAALGITIEQVWPALAAFPERWGPLVPQPLPETLRNNSLLIHGILQ